MFDTPCWYRMICRDGAGEEREQKGRNSVTAGPPCLSTEERHQNDKRTTTKGNAKCRDVEGVHDEAQQTSTEDGSRAAAIIVVEEEKKCKQKKTEMQSSSQQMKNKCKSIGTATKQVAPVPRLTPLQKQNLTKPMKLNQYTY